MFWYKSCGLEEKGGSLVEKQIQTADVLQELFNIYFKK